MRVLFILSFQVVNVGRGNAGSAITVSLLALQLG